MRTIICKRCGAEIDAEPGICPNCGTVYYILPQEETAQSVRETELLNDDVFSTRIINPVGLAGDETQVFRTIRENNGELPRVSHPVQQRQLMQREYIQSPPRYQTAPPKKGMSPKKKKLFVAGAALLALLVLVISIMSGMFNFGKNKNDNLMPPLEGMKQSTAVQILENMGARVEIQEEYNEAAAETVIGQSLEEGKKVKKGVKVTIYVSKGPKDAEDKEEAEPEYVQVPDLEGKTYDAARKLLTEMGLAIRQGEGLFSDKDEGKVVSQTPLRGAKLEKGDAVEVCLSKGEEPSPEPDAYNITVTAGNGGTISPKGLARVEKEKDQSFTITPDEGYEIREVKVDGTSVGPISSYTFTKVTGDHSIYAVFQKKAEPSPSPSPTPTPTPTQSPDESVPEPDNMMGNIPKEYY